MKKIIQSKLVKSILIFIIYFAILYALNRLVSNIKYDFYINIKNQDKLFYLTMNLHKQIYTAFFLGGVMAATTSFVFSTSPKEKIWNGKHKVGN